MANSNVARYIIRPSYKRYFGQIIFFSFFRLLSSWIMRHFSFALWSSSNSGRIFHIQLEIATDYYENTMVASCGYWCVQSAVKRGHGHVFIRNRSFSSWVSYTQSNELYYTWVIFFFSFISEYFECFVEKKKKIHPPYREKKRSHWGRKKKIELVRRLRPPIFIWDLYEIIEIVYFNHKINDAIKKKN